MIEVETKVKVWDPDDKGADIRGCLCVLSHWNYDTVVVLDVSKVTLYAGKLTVQASDLKAAIQNATNASR